MAMVKVRERSVEGKLTFFEVKEKFIIFAPLGGPTCDVNCAKLSACQHVNSMKINSILSFRLRRWRSGGSGNHRRISLLRECRCGGPLRCSSGEPLGPSEAFLKPVAVDASLF